MILGRNGCMSRYAGITYQRVFASSSATAPAHRCRVMPATSPLAAQLEHTICQHNMGVKKPTGEVGFFTSA